VYLDAADFAGYFAGAICGLPMTSRWTDRRMLRAQRNRIILEHLAID
jgi:hypothetical protein